MFKFTLYIPSPDPQTPDFRSVVYALNKDSALLKFKGEFLGWLTNWEDIYLMDNIKKEEIE